MVMGFISWDTIISAIAWDTNPGYTLNFSRNMYNGNTDRPMGIIVIFANGNLT